MSSIGPMTSHKDTEASDESAYGVTVNDEEVMLISGNAPRRLKEAAARWHKLLGMSKFGLGPTYGTRARTAQHITEVSLEPSRDDAHKVVVKMVAELEVTSDMCNALGLMDQGCMAGILDEGSAIALLLQKISKEAEEGNEMIGVSQNFNFLFYQPPPTPGTGLRVVSRSVSSDGNSGSCVCEIWDVVQHRLVVSGTQIQMAPSR